MIRFYIPDEHHVFPCSSFFAPNLAREIVAPRDVTTHVKLKRREMEYPLSFVCFRKKFGKNSLEGRPDVGPHGHKGAVTREKRERSRESSHKF